MDFTKTLEGIYNNSFFKEQYFILYVINHEQLVFLEHLLTFVEELLQILIAPGVMKVKWEGAYV